MLCPKDNEHMQVTEADYDEGTVQLDCPKCQYRFDAYLDMEKRRDWFDIVADFVHVSSQKMAGKVNGSFETLRTAAEKSGLELALVVKLKEDAFLRIARHRHTVARALEQYYVEKPKKQKEDVSKKVEEKKEKKISSGNEAPSPEAYVPEPKPAPAPAAEEEKPKKESKAAETANESDKEACPKCGKEYKKGKGLQRHLASCKSK